MIKAKIFISMLASTIISGCSFSNIKNDNCVFSSCNSEDMGVLYYDKEDKIKFYSGSFNEAGEYSGNGEFYYRNNERMEAESKDGYVINGIYYVIKNGIQYAILFNDEHIDPIKIHNYKFKNEVRYESVAGNFSYVGEVKNLEPNGLGKLFKNNLLFEGDFNKDNFNGKISNNDQTKMFEVENADNSVQFIYKNGIEKEIMQGRFFENKFIGTQTKYIKEKEIISYEGEWKLKKSPFKYNDFGFESFVKNGLFKVKSLNNKFLKGDYVNDQKQGYFELYKGTRLLGFDYYTNNQKLYYVPLYLEVQTQLEKNGCKYSFPETLNLWTPYKFKSCKNEIYNIEFIDKENKNLLMEMVYNKKTDAIEKLIIFDEDKKYDFIEINSKNVLGTKEYTLKGKADIYKWINDKYTRTSQSEISLKEKKPTKK